jgi:hypothetical protein
LTVSRAIAGHVNVPQVDAPLAFAVELEQRDAALAERWMLVSDLGHRIDAVGGRASEVNAFLERLPEERAQFERSRTEAAREHEVAQTALAQAADATERERGQEAHEAARRREAHAATDVRIAEERLRRLAGRRDSLERRVDEVTAEAAELERETQALAAELAGTPRVAQPAPPEPGLAAILEWTARAGAAVLVVRSGLETERDRVVREANELAASVLGEPLYTTSVAIVRQRLEQAASSPSA